MPNMQSQAATFRGGRYRFTGHLGTIPHTVVFSRAVNMASITYPLLSITFDDAYSGTGAYTDVKEDMLVRVYDQNTSTLKGVLRVAAGGSTSTVLQVNEFSKGWLDLRDNDRFEVVEAWHIWDKLVSATEDFDKDSRIAYVAQNDDYVPVANGGGLWFGFTDAGQSYATIAFDWTDSFPTDPDNSGGLTYSVDEKDATITVGTSTSSTCTMQVPAGFRHLELTVTDADNSETHTKQIPVYVYDQDTYTPLAVALERLSYTREDGWTGTFSLPRGQEAALSSLPDGALVVYFETERYGATIASYGSNAPASGRDHIKFVGYLLRDTIRITADGDEVTFEAVGPLGILNRTAALPQLMIRDSTPANWQELKGLTVNLALHYLWFWHSSIASIFDFLWLDGTDLSYARLAVEDDSSMAAQLRDIASSINAELTCDRLGRLLLVRDPNYLSISDRAGRTTAYQATTADLIELEFATEHRRETKFVRGEGTTPATSVEATDPVFSNAPGDAYGEGTKRETFSRKIATQATLNRITGQHYARVNGLWYDETARAITHVPQGARWTLPDGYDVIDPAYLEFLTLTLAASTNRRGRSFGTGTRWLPTSVDISYDAETGGKEIVVTLDHETHGPDGVTYTPPPETQNGIDVDFDLDLTFPGLGDLGLQPVAVASLYRGTRRIALIGTNGLARTTNFGDGAATHWSYVTWASLSVSGTVLEFIPNGFDPGSGWLITSTGVYYGDLATGTFTLKHTFASASVYRTADASFGTENHFVCVSFYQGVGTKALYTTDNSTFTEVTVSSNYDTNTGLSFAPGCYVSPKTAGLVYTSAHTNIDDGDSTTSFYRSTDYGATWSAVSNPLMRQMPQLAQCIHVPYAASDEVTVFHSSDVPPLDSATSGQLARANGGTVTALGPTYDSTTWHPRGRRSISTLPANANRLLTVAGKSTDVSTSNFAVFLTSNALASPPTFTVLAEGVDYRSCAISGDDANTFYLWGASASVGLSADGATIVSQVGDLTSAIGTIETLAGY